MAIGGYRVYVSAFELYRIGPGPSSSYTVGPQRAALRFVHDLEADGLIAQVARVEAQLYGGLAFHGRAHASDRAIVAGLAGLLPERCDAASLASCTSRAEADRALALGGRHAVRFDPSRDLRTIVDHSLANDGNAVRFLARNLRGDVVASRLYFSTGGGGVLAEGDAAEGAWMPRVPYPFGSATELLAACAAHGKRICDLVRANECALFSPGEVRAGLLAAAQAMRSAVERGLTTEGKLPGGRRRTAPSWADGMRAQGAPPAQMCAVYATAMAEENALGGRVVAAPSAGSAGPVAALLQLWRDSAPVQKDDHAIDFLLAGAAVGGLLRASGVRNVGCQGEVGVASAMAAAGLASVHNGSNAQVLHAAERALEPHLGLACDPAGARIEDPCIERNAQAAVRGYHAAMAAIRLPSPRVGLDVLARSLVASGRTMSARYKSASIGGLAVNVAEC
ncbi:MAG: L-serine ammonia-lyase [Burkholderiales bacterium]